ncbi:hypothetical protein [Wenyingzhuangia sp. IMCC45467]
MKKLSLLIALFIAIGAFAQKQSFTAEQKTQLMVKKMSLDLDLSEKQEAKIAPIIAEKVNKMEARIADFKEARKKGERPERKEISSEEKFNMAMTHLEEQKVLQNKMKNILNKEQYAQWKEIHKKRQHRGKEMAHHKMKDRFQKNKRKHNSKDDRKHRHEKPAA